MVKIDEPRMSAPLEDTRCDNTADVVEWTAKALEELADQLGVMNDFFYPLCGAVSMLRQRT